VLVIFLLLVIPPIATYASYSNLPVEERDARCITIRPAVLFTTIITLILALIVVAISLRKVHDAFYLKTEFKLIAIVGPLTGVPATAIRLFGNKILLGNFILIFTILGLNIISFLIPVILAIKRNGFTFSTRTLTSDESEKDDSLSSSPPTEKKELTVNDLVTDKNAEKFIEDYILHYQGIDMSAALLFYKELMKFKEIDNPLVRISRAYLMFGKFLKKGAYMQVDCITQEQKDEVEKVIEEAVAEMEKGESGDSSKVVPLNLFDGMIETVQLELLHSLLKPFKKSEYYLQYCKSIQLETAVALAV
jgi:hypothetical protein